MNASDARADRRDMDGEAERGEMLGGLTTCAGSQLGPPDQPLEDDDGVMTIPTDGEHHTPNVPCDSDTSSQDRATSEPT